MRLPALGILAAMAAALPVTGEIVLDHNGELGPGAAVTARGGWVARHDQPVFAGDVLRVRCQSSDFDPYLITWSPEQTQYDGVNVGSSHDAEVVMPAMRDGVVVVFVTTSDTGERGRYRLRIERRRLAGGVAALERPTARFTGKLTADDALLRDKVPIDVYSWRVPADHFVMVLVGSPQPPVDQEPAVEPLIRLPDQPDLLGTWQVLNQSAVTAISSGAGQVAFGAVGTHAPTGDYTIALWVAPLEPSPGPRLEGYRGYLDVADRLLPPRNGPPDAELRWAWPIPVLAGERFRFRVESSDFAPLLTLLPPAGQPLEVTAAQGAPLEAEVTCEKPGVLWVIVRGREPGAQGAFTLFCPAAEPAPPPG